MGDLIDRDAMVAQLEGFDEWYKAVAEDHYHKSRGTSTLNSVLDQAKGLRIAADLVRHFPSSRTENVEEPK